jgi:hypothetical protein
MGQIERLAQQHLRLRHPLQSGAAQNLGENPQLAEQRGGGRTAPETPLQPTLTPGRTLEQALKQPPLRWIQWLAVAREPILQLQPQLAEHGGCGLNRRV